MKYISKSTPALVLTAMLATVGTPAASPTQSGIQQLSVGRALQGANPAHKVTIPVPPPNPIPINTLPFAVNQPGYYRLTNDLAGTAGQNGITVFDSPVVIDLNGFTLVGVANSNIGISGVNEIVIINGGLVGWGGGGITLGSEALVVNVAVSGCKDDGMTLGANSVVQECFAGGNEGHGIRGPELSVFDSSIKSNKGDGIHGTGIGLLFAGCLVTDNVGAGISALDPFQTGNDAIVEKCQLFRNAAGGVVATSAAQVWGCTVREGGGLVVGDSSLVERCILIDSSGIQAGRNCRIDACTTSGGEFGIRADSDTVIENNSVSDASQCGVQGTGTGNRIESNNLARNGVGIEVTGTRNLIVRNSLDMNGVQLQIAAGNFQGPFLKTSGFIQSDNPWANFDLSFPTTFP